MADQTIKATEEMVGSGHGTKADTLNRLALAEHATDGTHGATAAATLAALLKAASADILAGTSEALFATPKAIHDSGISLWKKVPTASFTATPASTSTITMGVDLTASIKKGMTLKYEIDGVIYYGIVGASAAGLLTVWGAPLGDDVDALYYGGGTISQLSYDATVAVDGTANATVLKTGTVYTLKWQKPTSYLVFYQAYQTTADTGDDGKVTIKVNGTEVNTSAGGLVVAADATWYSTVVDIATAAYDINPGEDLTIVVTRGGTADGKGLAVGAILVTP